MKKARIFAFVMLVVLAVSFSACALAGTQAYNFNLRAVSSGLTGFRGSKNDDEARFYVLKRPPRPNLRIQMPRGKKRFIEQRG